MKALASADNLKINPPKKSLEVALSASDGFFYCSQGRGVFILEVK
jgi:hypothetical protein